MSFHQGAAAGGSMALIVVLEFLLVAVVKAGWKKNKIRGGLTVLPGGNQAINQFG